ncbi:MAG: YebC/PmpR family DNA-binding regulatory protein [Rhodothermales bacterium]|jgi:YebC/PmpR family DNA-binding regulatory protein
MSGHSKWSTIKHKKGAADAKRGKVFSRISKEITIATKMGGKDPDANPALRAAIASGKAANMPKDVILRAMKKGAGELGGEAMVELVYEGYIHGAGIVVDCLTDNRNRTAAEVRHLFNKCAGNMANSGAVSRFFSRKARVVLPEEHSDELALMEMLFEAEIDVENIDAVEGGTAEIVAPTDAFVALLKILEEKDIVPEESGIARMPDMSMPIDNPTAAKAILRLIDMMEDLEDVQAVYTNADIADSVLEQLAEE